MKKTLKGLLVALATVVMVLCLTAVSAFAAAGDEKWICAWGTAPVQIGVEGYDNIGAIVKNVTARSVITPSANGSQLRIRVSNYFGKEPMKLTRVTVAKSTGGSKINTATVKTVTFNEGQPFVTVPAGKEYVSDPITFDVVAGEKIAVSIYIEDFTEIKTMGLSGADTYLAIDGDYTVMESMDIGTMMDDEEIIKYLNLISGGEVDVQLAFSFVKVVPCLASVDVLADEGAYSVVVVGDSTVANEVPKYIAQAVNDKGVTNVGVAGKGVIGNRLLGEGLGYGSLIFGESLLDRFKRDVLSQSGVEYVVVKIGANDIIHPVCNDIIEKYPDIQQPTALDIIEGYEKLFKMCHNAGIKVIAMSITPWKGATRDYLGTGAKYVRTEEEFQADWKIAKEVNAWLANTSAHDGYINLNAYSANPKKPDSFYPDYTIDGIHPSDTMQRIWGEKFPQSLIGIGKAVAGVRISKTAHTAYVGDKFTLKASVYPSTAKNKSVKWKSSNSKVAKVSSSGVVECLASGTAVITCTTVENEYTASCKVTVRAKPTSITLNKTSATIYTTKSVTLTAKVLPSNAYGKTVTWSSSNTKVATVSSKGVVTGVGSGKAVISAKTALGGLVAKCTVTVKPKVQVAEIALNRINGTMIKGRTSQLTYSIYPDNATYPEVTWSTTNKKVVTVDKTGKLKAVGAGKAIIVCRSVDNPRVLAKCTITVVVKTTGVTLSHKAASLYEGYSGKLTATVSPKDATDKSVKWTSSDKKIATVDSNGKITAIRPGKVVITCKTNNGGYTAKCTITVKKVIKTTSVKLNTKSGTIKAGTYYQLKATVLPENATIKKVYWTSSNKSVAKVSSTGKVFGLKAGTAVITCKTLQGGKTATFTVKVVPVKVTGVKLNIQKGTMAIGKTFQLKATVLPENATNKAVTWSSSDPSAVSVSSTGVIKALKANSTAVITCKTVDGAKKATCTIKVLPIAAKGVKLNKTAITVSAGKSATLYAAVYPTNASDKTVVWSSKNSSIASVNQNGVVTGRAGGTTIIYCKTRSGGHVASCKVTVKAVPVLGVMLDRSNFTGYVGSVFTLTATVVPENATNKAVKWVTTDAKVATVNQYGRVVCVGKGTCQIRAITLDGNYIESCKVTVK